MGGLLGIGRRQNTKAKGDTCWTSDHRPTLLHASGKSSLPLSEMGGLATSSSVQTSLPGPLWGSRSKVRSSAHRRCCRGLHPGMKSSPQGSVSRVQSALILFPPAPTPGPQPSSSSGSSGTAAPSPLTYFKWPCRHGLGGLGHHLPPTTTTQWAPMGTQALGGAPRPGGASRGQCALNLCERKPRSAEGGGCPDSSA